jgi:uncharacterized protein YeeX (DUF496 family)
MKSQALLQRVAEITAEYENKVADLRVHLTVLSQERDEWKQKYEELAEGSTGADSTDSSDD